MPLLLKEIELDGYKCKVYAATYRQFMQASKNPDQMEGTANLVDEVCKIETENQPASSLLSLQAVDRVVSISLGKEEGNKVNETF